MYYEMVEGRIKKQAFHGAWGSLLTGCTQSQAGGDLVDISMYLEMQCCNVRMRDRCNK